METAEKDAEKAVPDWAERKQCLPHLYLESFSNFRKEFIPSGFFAEGMGQRAMSQLQQS